MGELVIDAADCLVYRDGSAELLLYGRRAGDPTPQTVAVGPMPAARARAVVRWLSGRGRAGMGEVWDKLRRLEVLGRGFGPRGGLRGCRRWEGATA